MVIPLRRLDQVGQKALRFALSISREVYVVQVLAEELDTEDLQARWRERVEHPVRQQLNVPPPLLVLIRSPYRQFFQKLLAWLRELTATRPDRQVIVLIPELVQRRWYQFVVSHRAMRLKAQLLLEGGPHISLMSTPWYSDLPPRTGATGMVDRTDSARKSGGCMMAVGIVLLLLAIAILLLAIARPRRPSGSWRHTAIGSRRWRGTDDTMEGEWIQLTSCTDAVQNVVWRYLIAFDRWPTATYRAIDGQLRPSTRIEVA